MLVILVAISANFTARVLKLGEANIAVNLLLDKQNIERIHKPIKKLLMGTDANIL